MHIELTFPQHGLPNGCLKHLQNHPAVELVHKWWDLPLFDVRLPECQALAVGGNSLVPGAHAGNADVVHEEEAEDEAQ